MKEQIFISYKREDKERVFAIKDFIEQNTGAKCWIDLDGLESNAQFADKIGTAIDNCQVFIFMRSNAHNTITNLAKDWTYREVNYALDEDKNIIVINIDQSPMPKWFKMLFPNKQEIDATNSDMLNRLCDDLCSWLGILKPIAEQDSESQKKAKREALPKVPFRVGNLTYTASRNGGVSVCGCDKSLKEVHIPAKVEYDGYTYDVNSIGAYAFDWCKSLRYITIPDSVISIGGNAFSCCSGLTSITIPNSVIRIGEYAFSGCYGLTSITIPEGVTNIGDKTFLGCSSLTSITIPEGVTNIGDKAFLGCSSLTSISIPNSVTSIDDRAFSGCSGLTSIIVEKGNKKYDSRENCNAIIETATNTLIRGCDNTIIPNSVTSIGDNAFRECSGLISITIPNSVMSIGRFAFNNCSSLTSIIVAKGNKKYDSRENCNAIIETATNTLISGCKNTIIPDTITSIGNSAFFVCESLTSISIPNSVTSIGYRAFSGCSGLTSISIPKSVTNIADSAFESCSSLSSITIPNSVTSIGRYAFNNCSSLTSISIPDSVTSIGERAFDMCSSLKEISIPKQLTSIGEDAIPAHTRVRKRGSFWPF